MTRIPRAPLFLGLAGLIPFVWSVVTVFWEPAATAGMQLLGARFVGPYVGIAYGTIILSFMSGVLWGFAANARGQSVAMAYALSVIPALWVFFFVGGGAVQATIFLVAGFLGLLALDWVFSRLGMTPDWWMELRVLLTAIVVSLLVLQIYA